MHGGSPRRAYYEIVRAGSSQVWDAERENPPCDSFGDRSQRIRNAPTANIFRSAKELELLLARAEKALAQSEQQALGLAAENDQLHALLRVPPPRHQS
jgi:hypothetical protein